jgi:hypothetical protein
MRWFNWGRNRSFIKRKGCTSYWCDRWRVTGDSIGVFWELLVIYSRSINTASRFIDCTPQIVALGFNFYKSLDVVFHKPKVVTSKGDVTGKCCWDWGSHGCFELRIGKAYPNVRD